MTRHRQGTIAHLIDTRLRQIDSLYATESTTPQNRATGGAVRDPLALAREREQRLWDALQPDRIVVPTPDGPKRLSEITELASGLKEEMRVERGRVRRHPGVQADAAVGSYDYQHDQGCRQPRERSRG